MRIRVNSFGGLQPNTDPRLLPNGGAQIAHNCLLEDGSLQAMPQWSVIGDGPTSVGPPSAGTQYSAYFGYCGMTFYGPPFGTATIYLNTSGQLVPNISCSAIGSMHTEPAGLSLKPVNRVYGVTAVQSVGGVDYESAMSLVSGNNPKQVIYEGDVVTLTLSGTGTAIRLYRSTSDVTTGAGTNGAVTANWQMVAQLSGISGVYVDGGAAAADAFDTYLYRGPMTPPFLAYRMGLLDSGYIWLVSEDGQIALSDRYTWGAWPIENWYSLGNAPNNAGIIVTGTASTRDVLYVGTQIGVFMAVARPTEEGGMVMGVDLIVGSPPCLPNTMTATPSGAMYTCAQGVVSVAGDQATLVSRALARGTFGYDPHGNELLFADIGDAIYHNGRYYGVSGSQPPPLSLTGHLVDAFQATVVTYQYLFSGGVAPRNCTVFSGTFPAGLSISSTGLVTGKRTAAGAYSFRLKGVDAVGTIVYLDDTSVTISTDIVNWTSVSSPSRQTPTSSGIFGNVITIMRNNNFLDVSPDRGVTWAQQYTAPGLGLFRGAYIINFQGDWYVFDTPGGSNNAAKTVGSLTPLVFTSFGNVPYASGVGVLGNHLYIGDYASIGTTYKLMKLLSPGAAWQTIDTGVVRSVSASGITGMAYTGSAYIFVTGNGDILRSTDLIYFTLQASGLSTYLDKVSSLNGVVVASGTPTLNYHSEDDGLTWGAITSIAGEIGATPTMFVGGYAYGVFSSIDASTWVGRFNDNSVGALAGQSFVTPITAVFPTTFGAFIGTN